MIPNFLGEKFYNAAASGDIDTVKYIVTTEKSNPDFDVNYQNIQGNTALYIACSWGFQSTEHRSSSFYETVLFLIEHGADPNIANRENKTPLYIAAAWGHPHIVHLLILHGAHLNVQVPNNLQSTPLQIAAFSKRSSAYDDYEIVSKHHAYYIAKNYMEQIQKNGEYLRLFPEIKNDYKMLIAYSAVDPSLNIPDKIMDIIVKYNHFAVVKELVHAGADINQQDTNGKTALYKATYWNQLALKNLLIENGAVLEVVGQNIKKEISQSTQ